MDFDFNEEQKMLKRSVHDFLASECPHTLVREIDESKQDYSRDIYRKMADLGWSGLMIPEEYGGVGGNWVDMAVFYEEAGRALLQSPHFYTVVQAGQTILELGNDEQKKEYLPGIAGGDLVMSVALTEPEVHCDLNAISTTAEKKGEDYIINGTKAFIGYAHLADYIITAAKSREGVSLFLVDGKAEGLTATPIDTMGGERLCEVIYNNVRVPERRVIGDLGKGSAITGVINKAKIMTCTKMVGAAEAALNMAVEYSKFRVQFGVLIGTFQALQFKMADMLMALDGARYITYYAAWLNSEGLPSEREMSMA
ncbi:acyl-CoA dehydrogenase family protein, partial [Chloroflexota bacterium]